MDAYPERIESCRLKIGIVQAAFGFNSIASHIKFRGQQVPTLRLLKFSDGVGMDAHTTAYPFALISIAIMVLSPTNKVGIS